MMPTLVPVSPAAPGVLDASWMHRPITYLIIGVICLIITLRFLRRALAPIGVLIEAIAAAAVVAFTATLALTMLIIAAYLTAVR